ncbi:MAG: hypothetical protein M1814_004114 [Vezdaea aestivalis]|nr:MAG: hypothetical protein M1814_004114 [Vezdaea aestivalis]
MNINILSNTSYAHNDQYTSRPRDIMSRGRPTSASAARRASASSFQSSVVSPMTDDFPTPRASDFPSIPTQTQPPRAFPLKPALKLQTEYDDLYDISEDESEQRDVVPEIQFEGGFSAKSSNYSPSPRSSPQIRSSWSSSGSVGRKSLSLQIPSSQRKASPVVPSPAHKLSVLPSLLSFLAQEVPSSTAPPSLDGSLTSDQLANMESPPTPSTSAGGHDAQQWGQQGRGPYNTTTVNKTEPWEGLIQLDPEALATLQFLSEAPEDSAPAESVAAAPREMKQVIEVPKRRKSMAPKTPATPYSLADLDIPSPTLFFSSLAPTSRSTWCPNSGNPPTSATAEHFYIPSTEMRLSQPMEKGKRVEAEVEIPELPLTARQIGVARSATPDTVSEVEEVNEPAEYDKDYERNLTVGGTMNLARTSMWLLQQEGFGIPGESTPEPPTLSAISTPVIPSESPKPAKALASLPPPPPLPPKITPEQAKRAVRVSRSASIRNDKGEWVPIEKKEPIFYRAFQHAFEVSTTQDALCHSEHRLEALQVRRLCSQQVHKDRIEGLFQPLTKALADDASDEAKIIARAEKEQHALRQIDEASWNVAATKALRGGKLLGKPAAKRLARYSKLGSQGSRGRILDLGGQPVCDWGWACATEYPNAKVYTVVEKTARHPSAANIRGPTNHRVISVPNLWRLPFPDNNFDVISARSLHSLLRGDIPHGEWDDEYELCLKECMRCLKPGGYLEFALMDADLMRAGPLGSTMSRDFAYSLKSRGYDPYATRVFLGRLKKAGFSSIQRSWMFLPTGPAPVTDAMQQKSELFKRPESADQSVLASTREVAGLTGLVGGMAWERWMWKLRTEMGQEEDGFFPKLRSVLDEGAKMGAGWRCLNGYARKPSH